MHIPTAAEIRASEQASSPSPQLIRVFSSLGSEAHGADAARSSSSHKNIFNRPTKRSRVAPLERNRSRRKSSLSSSHSSREATVPNIHTVPQFGFQLNPNTVEDPWAGSDHSSLSRATGGDGPTVNDQRVVKFGLSLPVIFIFSVAIGVSYTFAYLKGSAIEWLPRDLTGANEWTSHTRTHLTQDPLILLDDLLSTATIGVDTSVSVNFLAQYGVASEVNVASTAQTFNKTWLDPAFITKNGYTIAGQMAGAFEGYGAWPCAAAIAKHPIVTDVCPDPVDGWFGIQIYNNLVTTTSEKASTFLSLSYTPMALMSARIWPAVPPKLIDGGIVVRGFPVGTHTERKHYLLKLEKGLLALAKVTACNRATQSNALECDHLENDDVYVRNFATRDFMPMDKLNKLGVYGPALALGNYVAADKNFVQLPATAILMTNTGYSATTRFSTTFPFRLTIRNNVLTTEYSIPQVASFSPAVGNGFASATAQLIVVCGIVFNAITHCRTCRAVAEREKQIFGFKNHITMGIVARRLGTYKIVFVQLCVFHVMNVGTYFSAVYMGTEKLTDTISFGAEGFLLVAVATMLLDQVVFFEKYSSVRETLTLIGSCGLYLVLMYLNSVAFLTSTQVQVTELKICAQANQCNVLHGYVYYYIGLFGALILPIVLVNGPIHWYVVPTRTQYPTIPATSDQLTSFEKYCIGADARMEFGDFSRADGSTPISIVHASGFTYVGPHLVRTKDYYAVVLSRILPTQLVVWSGITLTIFRIKNGRVIGGRHIMLGVAYTLFRGKQPHRYEPIK